MAVASLILGIIGLPLSFVFGVGLPFSLVSLIFGVIARKRALADGTPPGLATAGIATGASGLLLSVIILGSCGALWGYGRQKMERMARDTPYCIEESLRMPGFGAPEGEGRRARIEERCRKLAEDWRREHPGER